MPRMNGSSPANGGNGMQKMNIPGAINFGFSGVRPDEIGATEQTLVVVAMDMSSSLQGHAKDLDKTLLAIIAACQKSPRADNILLRLVTFDSQLDEIHGFKPVTEIKPGDYAPFAPSGMTALYDAAYTAVGSVLTYGKALVNHDLDVNGIVFIITDGMDNSSTATPKMIRDLTERALKDEEMESLLSILIGIGADASYLEDFRRQANLSQYVEVGNATAAKLAKMGQFISQSITSQSNALGTGGPSQILQF